VGKTELREKQGIMEDLDELWKKWELWERTELLERGVEDGGRNMEFREKQGIVGINKIVGETNYKICNCRIWNCQTEDSGNMGIVREMRRASAPQSSQWLAHKGRC
jgi:hypothetical protein